MMRSDAWRAVQSTLSPPVQNASFKDHRTVAFTKSIVPIEIEQYVEFDDSYRLFSPVLNANRYPTLKKRRRSVYIPNTLWTRSLAIIVIFKTILTVAIESWIFISIPGHLANSGKQDGIRRLRSFLGLYIFALFYELGLCYDALRRRNTFQLVGLCICNLGLLTYSILQMNEIKATITTLVNDRTLGDNIWKWYHVELILIPVCLAISTTMMTFVTWKLRAEFSWSIYKNISADLQMNRRYTFFQVYIALLKFDFFFIFGSQLQILLGIGKMDDDFTINAAMIPIAIVALTLAAIFCRQEKTKFLVVVMLCMSGIVASLVKTLVKMFNSNDHDGLSSYRGSLAVFASVAVLLIACTLINSVICIMGFHKGLKDHITQSRTNALASDRSGLRTQDATTRFVIT